MTETGRLVPVGQLVSAIITTQGATINQDDLFIKIMGMISHATVSTLSFNSSLSI
jgi:hypothetical protein